MQEPHPGTRAQTSWVRVLSTKGWFDSSRTDCRKTAIHRRRAATSGVRMSSRTGRSGSSRTDCQSATRRRGWSDKRVPGCGAPNRSFHAVFPHCVASSYGVRAGLAPSVSGHSGCCFRTASIARSQSRTVDSAPRGGPRHLRVVEARCEMPVPHSGTDRRLACCRSSDAEPHDSRRCGRDFRTRVHSHSRDAGQQRFRRANRLGAGAQCF